MMWVLYIINYHSILFIPKVLHLFFILQAQKFSLFKTFILLIPLFLFIPLFIFTFIVPLIPFKLFIPWFCYHIFIIFIINFHPFIFILFPFSIVPSFTISSILTLLICIMLIVFLFSLSSTPVLLVSYL